MDKEKVKIAIVANNYGESYDGVGAYAKAIATNFSANIEKKIFSAQCHGSDSPLKKVTSFGMTKELYLVYKSLDHYDGVLIEYPFVEWNPFVIIAYFLLSKKAQKSKKKIIISLHEYARTNKLRKLVIQYMIKKANLTLVSDDAFKDAICAYTSKIEIRNIPTNIYKTTVINNTKDFDSYVFFGLINEAKAFNEMIAGWKSFNANRSCKLYIISATKLSDNEISEYKNYNISYIHNADENEIAEIMNSSTFCILPIKPEIDNKNGTFKTASVSGCISIGIFSDLFKQFNFIINMNSYDSEAFKVAFEKTRIINRNQLAEMSNNARQFGEMFTPQIISKEVEHYILKEIQGNR